MTKSVLRTLAGAPQPWLTRLFGLSAVLCFTLLGTGNGAYCAELGRRVYDCPLHNFKIELPGDWKEIPAEVLAKYNRSMEERTGSASLGYVYGWQLGPTNQWFELPYVLVQISAEGALTPSNIKHLASQWKHLAQREGREPDSAEPLDTLLTKARAGEMIHDPAQQVLWMHTITTLHEEGPIRGLMGMWLTAQGGVKVFGFSHLADFLDQAPVFDQIIRSVQLAEAVRYSADGGGGLVGGKSWWLVALAVAGIAVVLLALALARDKGARLAPRSHSARPSGFDSRDRL